MNNKWNFWCSMSAALIWWVNVEHFCSSSRAVFSFSFNLKLYYEKVLLLWREETNFSLKSPWWGFYVAINFDLIFKINVFRKFFYKEKLLKSILPRLVSCWVIQLHFHAIIPVFYFRNLFLGPQKCSHFKNLLDFLKFSRKVMELLSLSWYIFVHT